MTKELQVMESYPDYMVKDSKTFGKSRVTELKKLAEANVEVDGITELRRIKVQKITDIQFEQGAEDRWFFRCTAKIKLFN